MPYLPHLATQAVFRVAFYSPPPIPTTSKCSWHHAIDLDSPAPVASSPPIAASRDAAIEREEDGEDVVSEASAAQTPLPICHFSAPTSPTAAGGRGGRQQRSATQTLKRSRRRRLSPSPESEVSEWAGVTSEDGGVDGEEPRWEVVRILDSWYAEPPRPRRRGGRRTKRQRVPGSLAKAVYFQVEWATGEVTEEPAEMFQEGGEDAVADFYRLNPSAPGPPVWLGADAAL